MSNVLSLAHESGNNVPAINATAKVSASKVLLGSRIALLGLCCVFFSGIALAASSPDDRHIRNRLYIGGGAGIAMLSSPLTAASTEIKEHSGLATTATLGIDVSKHWSVEIYHAELGRAGVVDASSQEKLGEVRYRNYGASLLGYVSNRYQLADGSPGNAYEDEGYYLREGFSAFGRLGVSRSTYSTSANIDLVEREGMHIGGGVEFGWENGTAARAEVVRYDENAWAAVVGFMSRFGQADPYLNDPQTMFEPSRQDNYQTRLAKLAELKAQSRLSKPRKAEKNKRRPDSTPVLIFLPIVHFEPGSAELSEEAKDQLRILADTLVRYPYLELVMEGYTSSYASEDQNLLLSIKRAASVKRFLMANKINPIRLKTAAVSDRNSKTRNRGQAGRAENRRVEFSVYSRDDQKA